MLLLCLISSLLPFGTQRGSWRPKYCLQGMGDQKASVPSPMGSCLASGQRSQLSRKNDLSNACMTWKRCCCSVVSDSATPWTAARQASLSFTISRSLLKLTSIESVMPSNHLHFLFTSHLQFFAESESFPMSQFFVSGGQSIGASASKSDLRRSVHN